jgi:hypothetical protein
VSSMRTESGVHQTRTMALGRRGPGARGKDSESESDSAQSQ